MKNERELFEEWAKFQCISLEIDDSGLYKDKVTHFARKAWQAAKADVVPKGYCVVPKEPTEEMIDASKRRQWDELSLPMECMDTLKYKAMIEAGEL